MGKALAVGLFHFNAHWGGHGRVSVDRHCGETLYPFLTCFKSHPWLRASFELSGSGLEYIQNHHPGAFRLLRELCEKGQLELISSLYTPAIWIAFPRSELIFSIEQNQECLHRLGLHASPAFFSQEAFFGQGVASLESWFEYAICKDDYLHYYYDIDYSAALFRAGGMPVMVGSNHLLRELTARLEDGRLQRSSLSSSHLQHLQYLQPVNAKKLSPAAYGQSGDIRWFWYHLGDGNHFSATAAPTDVQNCFFDPAWQRVCVRLLDEYRNHGYEFGTVGELFKEIRHAPTAELPPLIEGNWNPEAGTGVLAWMGKHQNVWENDCGILSRISRARQRLHSYAHASENIDQARYDSARTLLLFAEISDSLAWHPTAVSVANASQVAEQALSTATRLLSDAGQELEGDISLERCSDEREDTGDSTPGLVGASGTLSTSQTCIESCSCVQATFSPLQQDGDSGVRFPFMTEVLRFCPAAMEWELIEVPLMIMKPNVITLPLTNGLLELSAGVWVIKRLQSNHVAAVIDRAARHVSFVVRGPQAHEVRVWQFFIYRGEPSTAIRLANAINGIPSVPDQRVLKSAL